MTPLIKPVIKPVRSTPLYEVSGFRGLADHDDYLCHLVIHLMAGDIVSADIDVVMRAKEVSRFYCVTILGPNDDIVMLSDLNFIRDIE